MPQRRRLPLTFTSSIVITFFYEVFLKPRFIQFQVAIHSIRLPKNSTVSDVINNLKSKVTSRLLWKYLVWIGRETILNVALTLLFYCLFLYQRLTISIISFSLLRLNSLVLMLNLGCLKYSITRSTRYLWFGAAKNLESLSVQNLFRGFLALIFMLYPCRSFLMVRRLRILMINIGHYVLRRLVAYLLGWCETFFLDMDYYGVIFSAKTGFLNTYSGNFLMYISE